MAVRIEMDMPDFCEECPFFVQEKGECYGKCHALPIKYLDGVIIAHQFVSGVDEERNKHCPLKEDK